MAGDLIPPPSPAGRPEPESSESSARIAESLWSGGGASASRASEEPPRAAAGARPPAPSPFRSRFGFVVGALIGIALCAVGLGVALALDASERGVASDGWSAWHPAGDDELDVARQVAEHVGVKYRFGKENQLVTVQSAALQIQGKPFAVALRTARVGGDIQVLDGNGVLYTLNGLGTLGSIAGGEPSEERLLLLKREALELALYTFRYADDVDMVVALLPPNPDAEAETEPGSLPPVPAMLYRPGDLRAQLAAPLAATVPPKTPRPEKVDLDAPEAKRIDALTRPNYFTGIFREVQDTSLVLVLNR